MIFKLYRIDHVDWDETRAVVVRAVDERAAREFVELKCPIVGATGTWRDPKRSGCAPVPDVGVSELILVDFRAG